MAAVPSVHLRDEGYDVIGDVHGQHGKLVELLGHLGYAERDGAWRHPVRRAVFVGDLIDRGQGQLEVLELAKGMVDAGTALIVMGNHEYNAIAWATLREDGTDHLRTRLGSKGVKNREQHDAFLAAVGDDTPLHDEWIDWFREMPLWLDLGGLRVVHACWHRPSMDTLLGLNIRDDRGQWRLCDPAMYATSESGTPEYAALECVLKGPEVRLPDGLAYLDKELHRRDKARIAWWRSDTSTYHSAALIPYGSKTPEGDDFPELPATVVSEDDASVWPVPSYDDDVPVVVGHYWSTSDDVIQDDRMICVDLSAAKDLNPLAAYRWSGESSIVGANLVWVGKTTG